MVKRFGKQIFLIQGQFPMAFNYKGCDIIFTSTGGRYVGYQKNGDTTIAYKLNNCSFN